MAINCAEAMWLLSRKLDDKIAEKDARLLSEHIKVCESCRKRMVWVAKADRAVYAALSGLFNLREMVSESVESVRQHQIIERGGLRRWHVILICVIVAAVVAGLILWLQAAGKSGTARQQKAPASAPRSP